MNLIMSGLLKFSTRNAIESPLVAPEHAVTVGVKLTVEFPLFRTTLKGLSPADRVNGLTGSEN